MKKIYKIITLLFVVIFLVGCAANANVNSGVNSDVDSSVLNDESISLENQDENLTLPEIEIQPITNVSLGDFSEKGGVYDSIGEMANAIKTLDFSEDVIQALKQAYLVTEDEDGVCVMSSSQDDIYYVTVPQGCTVRNPIEYSTYYTYQCMIGDDKVSSASLFWFHNDVYNQHFSPKDQYEAHGYLEDAIGTEKVVVTRRGIEMDKYTLTDKYGTRELYIYTLTEGDKTLYVAELYVTEVTELEKVSTASEYPCIVDIHGIDDGEYFRAYVNTMKTHVTNEWLLEFGVQKYQSDAVTE